MPSSMGGWTLMMVVLVVALLSLLITPAHVAANVGQWDPSEPPFEQPRAPNPTLPSTLDVFRQSVSALLEGTLVAEGTLMREFGLHTNLLPPKQRHDLQLLLDKPAPPMTASTFAYRTLQIVDSVPYWTSKDRRVHHERIQEAAGQFAEGLQRYMLVMKENEESSEQLESRLRRVLSLLRQGSPPSTLTVPMLGFVGKSIQRSLRMMKAHASYRWILAFHEKYARRFYRDLGHRFGKIILTGGEVQSVLWLGIRGQKDNHVMANMLFHYVKQRTEPVILAGTLRAVQEWPEGKQDAMRWLDRLSKAMLTVARLLQG